MWLPLTVASCFYCLGAAEANTADDDCLIKTNGVCLPKTYTKNELPVSPIKVNVTLLIEQITEVDDENGTVDILAFIYLYWVEQRLTFYEDSAEKWGQYTTLNLDWMEKLWFPDLYIYRMSSLKIPEVIEPYKGMSYGRNKIFKKCL